MSVGQAGAVKVDVHLDGDIPPEHINSVVVDRDVNQPDQAVIVLSNSDHRYSKKSLSGKVEIAIGDQGKSIYVGEIVGLEPSMKGGDKSTITIRAYNKVHRLLRIRKSMTYKDKTDQQILEQVVKDAGLTLAYKHEKNITYKHVYQHNQNGLEFLRTRSARMGCHMWCVDSTVNVKQIDLQQAPSCEIRMQEGVGESGLQLRSFTPRVSGSQVAKKMTCKGWNPETKELINGEYSAQASRLGSTPAHEACGEHGKEENFMVDHPIWSKEEADALAKAKLIDANLTYMTGEAECIGDPQFDIAKVVKIMCNPDEGNDTFNGGYYVMGLTYRYSPGGKDKGGGFVSHLRLARDAQNGS